MNTPFPHYAYWSAKALIFPRGKQTKKNENWSALSPISALIWFPQAILRTISSSRYTYWIPLSHRVAHHRDDLYASSHYNWWDIALDYPKEILDYFRKFFPWIEPSYSGCIFYTYKRIPHTNGCIHRAKSSLHIFLILDNKVTNVEKILVFLELFRVYRKPHQK